MTSAALFWLAVGGWSIGFLGAIGSKVLAELPWHELQEYCRRRKQEWLFDEIHDLADEIVLTSESVQLLGTTLLVIGTVGWSTAGAAGSLLLGGRLLGVWLGLALFAIVTLSWIPHEVARRWGPAVIVHTWRIWRAADLLLRPLSWGPRFIRAILRRLDGHREEPSEEEALEDEILSIVTEGQYDGLLEAGVRDMIEGVIELDDTDVADIMTPRSEMNAVQVDMNWSEMLEFVISVGRTRIPVYDKNLDDIIGILYVKDLLPVLAQSNGKQQQTIRKILRPAWKVPRTQRLDELLKSFLKTRNHMAIVVDEFMQVAGLVTIEDVLEEIVGEIVDESDKEQIGDIQQVSESVAEIYGRAHVEEINEQLGTQLPEDDEFDTIGGFLLNQLGRIPKEGDSLVWHNTTITVLEASRRRVERVRLEMHHDLDQSELGPTVL